MTNTIIATEQGPLEMPLEPSSSAHKQTLHDEVRAVESMPTAQERCLAATELLEKITGKGETNPDTQHGRMHEPDALEAIGALLRIVEDTKGVITTKEIRDLIERDLTAFRTRYNQAMEAQGSTAFKENIIRLQSSRRPLVEDGDIYREEEKRRRGA